jgi:hypothetical protein
VSLRTSYNSIRNRHNPALSKLLAEHYRTHIAWDSPVASIVRKWADSVKAVIGIALLQDIIINKDSTLWIDGNVKSLLARNIVIHRTGRLVSGGGYLKIWANSIERMGATLVVTQVGDAPWKLGI